ncbi:MAG: NADH-quinone oxidoreductase subunit NuoE [Planctomycetes bacterium]|nr:NADH-quinone oxidoreductase subunit NuoE [Planctomycetota bacterium]
MEATELRPVLDTFERRPDVLISLLQAVQARLGYLPPEAIDAVARHARVPRSRVYGVASFYSQFRFNPVGRQRVAVCRGTACHVSGARLILEEAERTLGIHEGETTADREYSLETVACIGCCGLSPCLSVNGEVSAKLTPKKVRKQFRTVKKGAPE